MNRNSKKGFTIVELIIVIAVIAVLAAVLIPTFSNLIQKANEAKDTALVSDLNKGLKMSGKNFTTMHEALQAVEENVGINVAKISAAATHSEVLWDSVNNCFVYNANGTIKYIPDSQKTTIKADEQYKYWQIVEEASNTATYSQYLAGDNHNGAVTVNTGFDAGKNANLKSVTYTNEGAQNVVIRTNGGELVVDAGNATVAHYGAANYVNIENVYDHSFHEYGVAAVVRIAKGHFVAEATAKVINLNVAGNNVKITETDGAKVVGYTKAADDITVTVNGETKKAEEVVVKTKDVVETEAKSTDVVAEGGIAEVNGIQFKSLEVALNKANSGDTVTLLSDIVIEDTLIINKKLTLNLNGKTISNEKDIWNENTGNWSIMSVRQNGDLTITGNGTIKAKDYDCYTTDVQGGAVLTIENGTFVSNISAAYVYEGTAYIKGGTYSVVQKFSDASKADGFVLNCYDASYKNGTAKILVTGGTFKKFDAANCWAEGANTNFCEKGYTTVSSNIPGTKGELQYTVVKAN